MTRAEEQQLVMKLVEVVALTAGLKAENARLKDENAYLRKLLSAGEP